MDQGGELTCCAVCNVKSSLRCARCLKVYYCNTEHQRQDWRKHRSECTAKSPKEPKINSSGDHRKVSQEYSRKSEDRNSVTEISNQKTANEASESVLERPKKSGTKSREKSKEGSVVGVSKHKSSENNKQSANSKVSGPNDNSVISRVVYTSKDLTGEIAITYEGSSEQEILNETAQQLSTVEFSSAETSNVLKAVNRTGVKMPVLPVYGMEPSSGMKEYPEASLKGSAAPFNHSSNSYYMDSSDPWYKVCQQVIRDMTQYGVCVLNSFLGKERGQLVLSEVLQMYTSGIFSKGQLVSNPSRTEAQTIRSDLITWIDGKEEQCFYIKQLISQVDNIILRANKMADNGKMGDYSINGRTKAMVACYPGSGSHYVKHVDNPNSDGRCITAIYYLNLDWDVKRCGGLLRVFPEGTNQVADIEPIFDRMLFFWSDRRNPHEVQPAYGTRYAITLWYFDAQERKEALRRFKEQRIKPSSSK